MNLDYLDSYCERSGDPALWAEPINAITNLAFLVAAFLAFQAIKETSFRKAPDSYILCFTLFCIGIGSGLWHTYASPLTVILDVIPITIFINIYLAAFLYRAFSLRWWQIALAIAALQAVNAAAGIIFDPATLHGTILYLPTYLALGLIKAVAWHRKDWFAKPLALILALWTCSLIFRTIDVPLCTSLPLGTHGLWHLCNAVVLYKLLLILLRLAREKE